MCGCYTVGFKDVIQLCLTDGHHDMCYWVRMFWKDYISAGYKVSLYRLFNMFTQLPIVCLPMS